MQRPGRFDPRRRDPVPIAPEAEWALGGQSGGVRIKSFPHRISIPEPSIHIE